MVRITRPIFSFDAHNRISGMAVARRNGNISVCVTSCRQILYAGRIYQVLELGWQTVP